MADIIQFVPKAGSEAGANVRDFIAKCRDELTIFGDDLDWDADVWDVTSEVEQRGRSGRLAFSWTNFDTSKTNTSAPVMVQPYLDFARAYMRYQHGMKPTTAITVRLAAVRALERALSENGDEPNISKADAAIFNRAAALLKAKYGDPYGQGRSLEQIATLVTDLGLVPVKFIWKSPLKRGNRTRNRVGKQFDEDRNNKLPAPGALDALCKVFHIATEPADVIIASTGALLTTSPGRINEVFALRANCEVEKTDSDGNTQYGIRWYPSKGAEPYVKYIGATMVDIAKLAIQRLREQTQSARDVAKWYEKNPGKMYLSEDNEWLRNEDLVLTTEFADAVGHGGQAMRQWAKTNSVPIHKIENNIYLRFSDVEAAVIRSLPDDFPIMDSKTNLKYSDALYAVHKGQFRFRKGWARSPCIVSSVGTAQISNGLGASVKHSKSSLFSRNDFTDDDGAPLKITTHQFRHWLNTIAQKGGLSQLDIAKWSGRKDVRQNEAYDHVTADEMIMMVREIDDGSMFGPLAEVMDKMPVSREDFLQMKFPTAHTTEYGFCVHDYTMLPCQKHRDCINCTEHACLKGDAEKTQRIRATLDVVKEQIEKAAAAIEEGAAGADRWYEHHIRTAERLQGLVDILDNPDVPIGSVIQLAIPDEYSPIKNAVDDRKALGDKDADMLNDMRALMGGS